MSEIAELRTAYHWFCPSCDATNFVLPMKAELTDDEREECFRSFNELDEWEELPDDWRNFEMVWSPDAVTCSVCHKEFATRDERDADELEEDGMYED